MKKTGIIFLLTMAISGCATLIRGRYERLVLMSEPAGALAEIPNGQKCITPCTLPVRRNHALQIKFSKEDCRTKTTTVVPFLADTGVWFANSADYSTGAVYDLQPNPVNLVLDCKTE